MKNFLSRIDMEDLFFLDQEIKSTSQLMEQKANTDAPNQDNFPPESRELTQIKQAIKNKEFDQFKQLFESSSLPPIERDELMATCVRDNAEVYTEYLLNSRMPVTKILQNIFLFMAIDQNKPKLLSLLFAHGFTFYDTEELEIYETVDPEIPTRMAEVSLSYAFQNNRRECLEILLPHLLPKENLETLDEVFSSLYDASSWDTLWAETVQFLLQDNEMTNLDRPSLKEIMQSFCFFGNGTSYGVLEQLIPELNNPTHLTELLFFAARQKNMPLVQFLIEEKKLPIDVKSKDHINLYHLSLQQNNYELFCYCIAQGYDGISPFYSYDDRQFMRVPLDDLIKILPLNQLIRQGRYKEVRILLSLGADVYEKDGLGLNAFEILLKCHLASLDAPFNNTQQNFLFKIKSTILNDLKRHHQLRDAFYDMELGGMQIASNQKSLCYAFQPVSLKKLAADVVIQNHLDDSPRLIEDLQYTMERYKKFMRIKQ